MWQINETLTKERKKKTFLNLKFSCLITDAVSDGRLENELHSHALKPLLGSGATKLTGGLRFGTTVHFLVLVPLYQFTCFVSDLTAIVKAPFHH